MGDYPSEDLVLARARNGTKGNHAMRLNTECVHIIPATSIAIVTSPDGRLVDVAILTSECVHRVTAADRRRIDRGR